MYDVRPEKFGLATNVVRRPSHYGDGASRTSDFFTFSVDSRLAKGIEFGGSVDTGRTVEDMCFVVDSH